MPRLPRAVVPNFPHQVTQRGTNHQKVFFDDQDRRVYLKLLQLYAEEYSLAINGYCLMLNHVHLVATPSDETCLASALGRTHGDYSRYVHAKHGGCGHLWQARFYSCVLSESHRWWALAYVENNPVRVGAARLASDYAWSSAAAHAGGAASRFPLADEVWLREYGPDRWRMVLETDIYQESLAERLRQATAAGRPFGDDGFVARMEIELDRPLKAQRRGPTRAEADPRQLVLLAIAR